jgi:hypothetical protein
MSIQKFPRLSFVHVKHDSFHQFKGIIKGTFAQIHEHGDSQRDWDLYAIYHIQGDKIVNYYSWVHVSDITLEKNQDPVKAEQIIEDYLARQMGPS